ncbi:MAG: stage II sporulation protein M [Capsulimonadaceae bacterium]|nr:stage II sporulation protein M [Capsulimonadaceae bacterium]
MFDERSFITAKQQQWKDLDAIVDRVKFFGLRRLPTGDLTRIGSLYRRTCADLAYARAQRATPGLVDSLNQLVGNAHGLLYAEDREQHGLHRLVRFITQGFPAVMRRRMPFVAAAFLLSVAGYLIGYYLCRSNPGNISLFIPDAFRDSVDAWKKGFADHGDISLGNGVLFSSSLMTHNTEVGIAAFATGITILAPIYLMLSNGWLMGALVAVVAPGGKLGSFWPGILPHGVCELSAIFICAAAGLLLGWSLIAPGEYTRRDALVRNGKDAVKLMLGTIPLFIVAGIIEGNVSHSSLPHWAKYTLAGIQFAALAFYIYGKPIKRRMKQAV